LGFGCCCGRQCNFCWCKHRSHCWQLQVQHPHSWQLQLHAQQQIAAFWGLQASQAQCCCRRHTSAAQQCCHLVLQCWLALLQLLSLSVAV
jgi:hypothetical protein